MTGCLIVTKGGKKLWGELVRTGVFDIFKLFGFKLKFKIKRKSVFTKENLEILLQKMSKFWTFIEANLTILVFVKANLKCYVFVEETAFP